ncbi:hypothetical protein St703_24240 [Sporolactobacillus terrae]|nr:hypothetical protein St703_24240 [Sporolactobacillus terrae]
MIQILLLTGYNRNGANKAKSGLLCRSPKEGGQINMTVYEALTLAIAFSSLLITLIGVVVSIIVVLSNKDKK